MNNLSSITQKYLNSILYNMNLTLKFKYDFKINEPNDMININLNNGGDYVYMPVGDEILITDMFPFDFTTDYQQNQRMSSFNYYIRLNYMILDADFDDSDNVEIQKHDFLLNNGQRTFIDFSSVLGLDYPIYLLNDFSIIIEGVSQL